PRPGGPGEAGHEEGALFPLLLQLRPHPGVGLLGLLGADEAVAVGVDLLEVLVGAEELLARDVAVAVAVHLPEPQRPAAGAGRAGPTGGDHARPDGRGVVAVGPLVAGQLELAGDLLAADAEVAVGVVGPQPGPGVAQLAHAQLPVAVGVEQLEQP